MDYNAATDGIWVLWITGGVSANSTGISGQINSSSKPVIMPVRIKYNKMKTRFETRIRQSPQTEILSGKGVIV